MNEKSLGHLRVLDLTRILAGPWCTQLLADLGADVIKIERPGAGDDTRTWGPPYLKDGAGADTGEAAYYLAVNRGKRSVTLDISKPAGQELVRTIARSADIFIENYRVGQLARYGLDYATLAAENPRLIYCSITGFGQTGPYRDRAGYDFIVQGMGGFMSITGEEDGPPLRAGVAMCDLSTGMFATVSMLAALRHAERTGEGQQIDISLLDTQIAMLANQASSYLVGGVVPGRMGNRHPTVVPYTTFEVTDGTVIIAIGNDSQFRAFCTEMGVPELGTDPRFAAASARVVNRDAIEELMRGLVAHETRNGLIARLEAAGVPVGPVNTVEDVFADPFVEARQTVHRFKRADGVEIPSVAFPGKLSVTPADYRYQPPKTGEQSRELLGEWLGLGEAELDALETNGVIKQA